MKKDDDSSIEDEFKEFIENSAIAKDYRERVEEIRGPIESILSEQQVAAVGVYQGLMDLMAAGFSRSEALEMLKIIVKSGMDNKDE